MYQNDKQDDTEHQKDTAKGAALEEKLIKTRSIFISGEVNQELAQRVSTQLLVLQEINDDPIYLYINSQGGHVEAGDTIHDMIKFVRPEVVVIGTGWVASAGVTIYIAAEKENRFCLPNTRFMIHQPLGQVNGKASSIEIEANELLRIRSRVNKLISDATGKPLEQVEKDTDNNYWMDPNQAIEYGLVNKVISKITDIR
ncbi:ATP-dependent Clp protease proteolytic subunit precursor [Vibrio aerogenes CECT 7868]|uniref:ATP-dependent Clp protease proteolytic subunit n=1 Tax=Vibrio aerogenes CECT 7868 TaxID=1216006 RepID=A0A1M5Y243_9VIBR|nr:ATP-dependent Clp protease proteolytic subunit [Vibrio aerogenes]SHI06150.1 ATP-dependent Clp protease proteolytic subunit precursor [Vibrio aerogenes CECT 7868]